MPVGSSNPNALKKKKKRKCVHTGPVRAVPHLQRTEFKENMLLGMQVWGDFALLFFLCFAWLCLFFFKMF